MSRWADQIRKFAGKRWLQQTQDRVIWWNIGAAFVLQWTQADVDDNEGRKEKITRLNWANCSSCVEL